MFDQLGRKIQVNHENSQVSKRDSGANYEEGRRSGREGTKKELRKGPEGERFKIVLEG